MTTETQALSCDQRGAVLIMGVFLAALLIGFIYFVLGIGATLAYRERLQDAADAAAFGAAITHSRGMNLLAFINVTMVGLFSVVLAFRLVQQLAWAAAFGAAVGGGNPDALTDESERAGQLHGQHVRDLFGFIRAANTASLAVADAIPLAAEGAVMDVSTTLYRPPVQESFPWPELQPLPIVNGEFRDTCDRAAPVASSRARDALGGNLGFLPPGAGVDGLSFDLARSLCNTLPSHLGFEPQHVQPGPEMGGELFQLRVVVGGIPRSTLGERGLKVASWGQDADRSQNLSRLGSLGSLALAQSEYYFDGDAPRDEWLLEMRWNARLRRLRLPPTTAYPCRQASATCDALDEIFQRELHRAAVH